MFFLKENKDLDLNEKTKIIIQHLLELDLDLDEELPEEYQMFNIPAITEEEKQRLQEEADKNGLGLTQYARMKIFGS